jgi:hypothetical protein
MTTEWTDDADELRCVFSGLPWRGRVREQARRLVRFSPLLVGLALLPYAFIVATGIDDDGRLGRFGLGLGAFMLSLWTICPLLAAAVGRMAPRTVTFTATTIVEESRGTTKERTWAWVVAASDDGQRLELRLRAEPMRSLRLAPVTPTLLLLDRATVGDGVYARMQRFLSAQQLLKLR